MASIAAPPSLFEGEEQRENASPITGDATTNVPAAAGSINADDQNTVVTVEPPSLDSTLPEETTSTPDSAEIQASHQRQQQRDQQHSSVTPSNMSGIANLVVEDTDSTKEGSEEDEEGCFHRHRECCRLVLAIFTTIIFLGLAGAGVVGTLEVFGNLDTASFTTAPGTLLGKSHVFKRENAGIVWENIVYIQVESNPPGQCVVCDIETEGSLGWMTLRLAYKAKEKLDKKLRNNPGCSPLVTYFSGDYVSPGLVGGPNQSKMLMMISLPNADATPVQHEVNRLVEEYATEAQHFTITVTGMPQLLTAMKGSVLNNMVRIDMICIPLGFVLFAVCVGTTPATLIVPLITLPVSLVLGLGAAAPLRHMLTITVFAPEIALSVAIALAMDFALFLLCRIKEQLGEDRQKLLKEGIVTDNEKLPLQKLIELTRPKGDTVTMCMKQVTHNITISGTAVTCAFAAIGFVYHDFVRGCALVSAMASAATTIVSLTLLPAVTFLMFGILFSECGGSSSKKKRKRRKGKGHKKNKNKVLASRATTLEDPLLSSNDTQRETSSATTSPLSRIKKFFEKPKIPEHNMWGRMATFSTNCPIVVLGGVVALMAFLGVVLVRGWSTDLSSFSTVPHDIEEWNNFHEVRNTFGPSSMSPYYIFLMAPEYGDSNLLTAEHWGLLQSITIEAKQRLALSDEEIASPTHFKGHTLSYGLYEDFLVLSPEYRALIASVTPTKDGPDAGLALAIRPKGRRGNSWGGEGTAFMRELQSFAEDFNNENEYSIVALGFYGPNLSAFSVMQDVMKTFKIQILATLGTLILVICVLFRAIITALRMVLTMAMTLAFSFGSIIFLMRWGYFSSVWHPLQYIDGYYWVVPILGFSIVCVVSLDYDVFLVTRIIEIRKTTANPERNEELEALCAAHRGATYSHDMACVISAVARTGPVISWAAAVMTIAFGVLCFSNTIMMAQYGLTIALAVIFDAFLVRPLIVPAAMVLIPSNVLWWPRQFNDCEEYDMLVDDESDDDTSSSDNNAYDRHQRQTYETFGLDGNERGHGRDDDDENRIDIVAATPAAHVERRGSGVSSSMVPESTTSTAPNTIQEERIPDRESDPHSGASSSPAATSATPAAAAAAAAKFCHGCGQAYPSDIANMRFCSSCGVAML